MCIIDEKKNKNEVLKKVIETSQMMLKNAPNHIKYRVIGIDWDCDGDPSDYNLPAETVIECDNEDAVMDELSAKYGWCIDAVEEIIPIS